MLTKKPMWLLRALNADYNDRYNDHNLEYLKLYLLYLLRFILAGTHLILICDILWNPLIFLRINIKIQLNFLNWVLNMKNWNDT